MKSKLGAMAPGEQAIKKIIEMLQASSPSVAAESASFFHQVSKKSMEDAKMTNNESRMNLVLSIENYADVLSQKASEYAKGIWSGLWEVKKEVSTAFNEERVREAASVLDASGTKDVVFDFAMNEESLFMRAYSEGDALIEEDDQRFTAMDGLLNSWFIENNMANKTIPDKHDESRLAGMICETNHGVLKLDRDGNPVKVPEKVFLERMLDKKTGFAQYLKQHTSLDQVAIQRQDYPETQPGLEA